MTVKSVIMLLVVTAVSISANAQSWPPDDMAGNGTNSNPWEITTADELAFLAEYVNAGNGRNTIGNYYKLMNDLDLSDYTSGNGWFPIGDTVYLGGTRGFHGYFDGNGKVVRNMSIYERIYCGLFGYTVGATIENLGMENCIISSENLKVERAGGLVAYADSASVIRNCYIAGEFGGSIFILGGLVGMLIRNSTINNCYTTGNLHADKGSVFCVGGLVGNLGSAVVSNCYSTASIYSDNNAGGIAGYSLSDATIKNCVAANDTLIGGQWSVINRILGDEPGNNLHNNYALNTMFLQDYQGNEVSITDGSELNGTGIDIEILQSSDFYTDESYWDESSWDMSVWKICDDEDMFPVLRWQNILCADEAGVAETQGVASQWSVCPNPTTGQLKINASTPFTSNEELKINSVEICDLNGRVLKQISNPSQEIDVSDLSKGIYFIKIKTKKGETTKRIVKN
ncbi:MAG: T9SS type A sorting domain-containing protein [Bacteroidales bacterium]|nr:T9SS type A sorting domain-containing protein [Bacteroidales bacterium]